MPVYNAEENITKSIESIINQSMNLNDIEVIFIDDCSSDNSRKIIRKYCDIYPNFKLLCLDNNIGAAYGPRNIGLEHVTGKFTMFLDSDDCFHPNACKILYDTINCDEDVDLVFARYCRIYPAENIKLKGYSPYNDSIAKYEDDITSGAQFKGTYKYLWKYILRKFIYGDKINILNSKIVIKDITKQKEIFKILPSIWTKIYRTSFIKKYDLKFPSFISGEDLNFVVESYFLSRKIVFLNEEIIHDYYMRDMSITKNITYPMVYDSLDSYYHACKICKKYNFKETNILLNPFLLNWIILYKQTHLIKDEKNKLYDLVQKMGKMFNNDLISRFLIIFIKLMLKI